MAPFDLTVLAGPAATAAPGGRLEVVPSVCPHDCTSTCALDVERLDARTIVFHDTAVWIRRP